MKATQKTKNCEPEPEDVELEPEGVELEPEVSDSFNAATAAAAPAKKKRRPPTCRVCGLERTAKNGHTKFQGTPYCQLGEGPGAKTPVEWRRQQRAAVAVDLPSKPGMPHRVTISRWRSRMWKDKRVRQEEMGKTQSQPGDPCNMCGNERTLDEGHAYFKGQFYCELEGGPGSLTAREWIAAQRTPDEAKKVPRTTLWNLKKRMERQAASSSSHGPSSPASPSPGPSRRKPRRISTSSSSPAPPSTSSPSSAPPSPGPSRRKPRRISTSSSSPGPPSTSSPSSAPPSTGPPRRKHKPHKPHKLRICQRCLQPAQKDFGHSRLGGRNFCALYAGKSVELWLAEKRDLRKTLL